MSRVFDVARACGARAPLPTELAERSRSERFSCAASAEQQRAIEGESRSRLRKTAVLGGAALQRCDKYSRNKWGFSP